MKKWVTLYAKNKFAQKKERKKKAKTLSTTEEISHFTLNCEKFMWQLHALRRSQLVQGMRFAILQFKVASVVWLLSVWRLRLKLKRRNSLLDCFQFPLFPGKNAWFIIICFAFFSLLPCALSKASRWHIKRLTECGISKLVYARYSPICGSASYEERYFKSRWCHFSSSRWSFLLHNFSLS